ncbi:RNA methyltransferase [Aliikangiella maris]|uniref:RNA methyltransferase n=2 Tax=Aliikangiella maris TaxID=3162458 RepID=A0ABV3MR07_9GAMM
MINRLSQIRIILLNTFHPGNIGAAARAMKTMGLSELVLVNPLQFPDETAERRAAGGSEILQNARVVESLARAITDCTQVFATSARQTHTFSLPQKSVEQSVAWIRQHPAERVAIVFGGERDGMSLQELALCQQLLYIPGSQQYQVLNVAAAVQIVCYELFKGLGESMQLSHSETMTNQTDKKSKLATQLATQQEMSAFYSHLEMLLIEKNYIRQDIPTDTLKKFKTFVNKAQPTAKEIALLRGMFKALAR